MGLGLRKIDGISKSGEEKRSFLELKCSYWEKIFKLLKSKVKDGTYLLILKKFF